MLQTVMRSQVGGWITDRAGQVENIEVTPLGQYDVLLARPNMGDATV